ncbi:hypothetical protein NQ317_008013 [Molorchus minor]|uniref:Uncharacterized protein n=1 Tax=Molorchus minor TaxID=1323400 RepID=A0ABQ9JXF0_9CUCU|nr:hypothetical protein NQ317_008013 [Molorchus minor]
MFLGARYGLRLLPKPSEPSRSCQNSPKPKTSVRGIDCDYYRNNQSPPDFSRSLKLPCLVSFPYIFRSKESIATISEVIRALPTFPDFVRTLPKAQKNTVFGVFPNFFRYEESIATVSEAIRELPNVTTATTFPKSPNE